MDSDSSSASRRRPLRDLDEGGEALEEGEYVPGRDDSDTDTDDDEELCRLQRRLEGELGRRVSWLEVVMASGRVAPSSWESDRTISDDGSPSAASSAATARSFACHVCGRRFHSPKAMDGHMRVHGNGRQVAAAAAVSGGWAATGKRGWTGGKPSVAVSLNSESTDNHSTAVVAVRPLEPIPMAIAMTSPPATPVVSTGTNLSGEESSSASAEPMQFEPPGATVVTGANNPSSPGAVVHQHAAPPPAAEQAGPVHHPAVLPPAVQQSQLVRHPLAPPRARPAQPAREYSCKLCGKSYSSHQGLGGHAAGHKTRQKEAEAAAAAITMGQEDGGAFLAAFRRGRRAQPPHECRKCHKVFPTGVALGGHMRMHYTGPPIVHRKNKKRGLVSEADLRLALSTATTEAPPPPPAPAAAGRVRLFGIDIVGPQAQAPPPPEEKVSSGTAEGSPPAGEQE
ncbi:hypothetical protein PAHAL_5G062200 [Panicum hallii]|jgi:hypothetical protein|uniref:C2H2-type domain-containing protein n=1 Tax=Panicum hallii TaxID=206008 RepID=A0A2S3HP77_9POAL|nr:hypothetical protein PAHAL_5G062200 [Panicum hallii]